MEGVEEVMGTVEMGVAAGEDGKGGIWDSELYFVALR